MTLVQCDSCWKLFDINKVKAFKPKRGFNGWLCVKCQVKK